MADVVLDANAVGQLVTYVAPGYVARMGYRARYPAPDRAAGEALIIAVALSLPLVALVNAVLPGKQEPLQFGYAMALLLLGLAVGYGAALARGTKRVKRWLEKIGYRLQPEGTMYAGTLFHMDADESVVIELKDGRRVWGAPRRGPQHKDDGVNELYLSYPKALWEDEWRDAGAAVIVPLSEINTIVLTEDPTAEDDDASDDDHGEGAASTQSLDPGE